MKILKLFLSCMVLIFLSGSLFAQADFNTSLHNTRAGKVFWYGAGNGGFETISNIPIDSLGCIQCHGASNADGEPYGDDYEPGCLDCHPNGSNFNPDSIKVDQCYSCHGRQKKEVALGFSDVHRDAGMKCWDCHTADDMHGDGTEYASMLEDGAIDVSCEDCHFEGGTAPYPDHSQYDPHNGKLDCTACHAQTVLSCYNCHFESMVEDHIKRAYKPINDFVILANREKDGKVYPMTFQSLTYQDSSFVAFGPFTSHTITKEGRKCEDCHGNENVQEYFDTGKIQFAEWNDADSVLTWKHGIVPMPPDYETTFKMDFITYNGNTSDPPGPSKNWSKVSGEWDGHQMFFATPLTETQMLALQKDVGTIADNFATSLHGTRAGKIYWYGKDNGGFEMLTNVPISEMGCVECHGPANADGVPNDENYKPGCVDCHPSGSAFNPDSIKVDQCYSCHGRQKKEIALGFTDVHRDAGMKCWDCHTMNDMHGDGSSPQSMLEANSIEADCANDGCHPDGSLPSDHAAKDPHNGKLHCTACHAQTVISCYNCHLESKIEGHLKRAYKPINDFVILANREKDGKVYPMTFQSLTYQGKSFVAFGPFTSHTITKEGARVCTDCHLNFGGTVEAIQDYNDDGILQFAKWNDEDSTLTWLHGVIPMPEDYQRSFKMDFITYNGDPHDPVGPSKNWSFVKGEWDGHQMFFATPLTREQMANLGFDTTLVGIKKNPDIIPTEFALEQNYPNPFNPTTVIQYSIPEATKVDLVLYDVLGNKVKTLVSKEHSPGVYRYEFDGSGLSSGIYFYRLITKEYVQTRKFVLMK